MRLGLIKTLLICGAALALQACVDQGQGAGATKPAVKAAETKAVATKAAASKAEPAKVEAETKATTAAKTTATAEDAKAEAKADKEKPRYLGVRTVLLQPDMVNVFVTMTGAKMNSDVEAYGRCAAAQYALIRGWGFARHIRTTVDKKNNTWHGDGVYLISAILPPGLKTIDAEVAVRDCAEQGIPTI